MSIPKETVVMGNQPDGLLKMEKFDGNETKIIWPAWRLELKGDPSRGRRE